MTNNYSDAMMRVAVLAVLVGMVTRNIADDFEIARILNMPVYKVTKALKELEADSEVEAIGLNWRYIPYTEMEEND